VWAKPAADMILRQLIIYQIIKCCIGVLQKRIMHWRVRAFLDRTL
jgi:hypothetical protein